MPPRAAPPAQAPPPRPLDGVRAYLPPRMREALERAAAAPPPELRLMFLVDATLSMTTTIEAVRANVCAVVDGLPEGAKVGICSYTDVGSGGALFGMDADFTDDRAALRAAAAKLSLSGGGDWAEAQYTGLALALRAASWGGDGGLLVHITDAPPHTREAEWGGWSTQREAERRAFEADPRLAGLRYDWVDVARALGAAKVMVCTFLIRPRYGGGTDTSATPYYVALAEATGAPGMFVAQNDARSISDQVMALVRSTAEASRTGAVSAATVEGMSLMVSPPEHKALLAAARCEEDARVALGSPLCRPVAAPEAVAALLGGALGGLVRADGAVKRFAAREGGQAEYAAKLFGALDALLDDLRAALREHPEEEEAERDAACAVSAATQRQLVVDFVEQGGLERGGDETEAEHARRVFVWVASLVMGAPIDAPFGGGDFNYEDAWSVRVRRVVSAYGLSYQAFLDYATAKRGGWQPADRGELGADAACPGLVLRGDGEITGVLPLAQPGAFGEAVFRALAASGWLAAVTWHSVCRHALPPPNAVPAALGCALARLIAEPPSEAGARMIAATVRSLRALPARAAKRQAEALDAFLEEPGAGEVGLRAAFTVQADCPPAKAIAVLAQRAGLRAPPPLLEVLTGELLARRLKPAWCGPERFSEQAGPATPLPDPSDDLFLVIPHPLEAAPSALGALRVEPAPELIAAALEAYRAAVTLLDACCEDGAPVPPLDADRLRFVALEAALLGPAGRAETGGSLAGLLHAQLARDGASELAALAARRRRHALDSLAVPAAAAALADPATDEAGLAAALAAEYRTPLSAPAALDLGDVPAILAAATGCSSAAKLRLLACGPWPGKEGRFCKEAGPVEFAARAWLAPDEAERLEGELAVLRASLVTGCQEPVAGSRNFNASLVRMAATVRRALGLPIYLSEGERTWTCGSRDVERAAAAGASAAAGMALVREVGPVEFVLFHQGDEERVAAWSVGPFARTTVLRDGHPVHEWPAELVRLCRERRAEAVAVR